MSNELTIRPNSGVQICGIIISSMAELLSTCDLLAKSDFVPVAYRGKPGNILAAIQFGREIGLSPMQALQGIAVVNGKPSVYGTTYLAVCHNAPGFRDIIQKVETVSGKLVATCTAKRSGRADVTRVFTQDMAIKAGIWNKNVHASYPETMLLWRATHLACDTMFADVLKGMPIRENAEVDYDEPKAEPVGATASERLANQLKGSVTINSVEHVETDVQPTEPETRTGCTGKVQHPDKATAEAAMQRLITKGAAKSPDLLNVYECEHCLQWHVGNSKQASTSPVGATKDQNTANDTQKADSQAAADRGAALWARWQATEGLPQRATTGTGRNELVNAALVSILGDKLATVRVFQNGTPEQLNAVETFLEVTDNAATEAAEAQTAAEEVDDMDPAHWDGNDEAPLLEMAAPDADSEATIGAMSR